MPLLSLGIELQLLVRKLDVAIVGLKAIISEGSDNLNIAEKTLQEIDNCNTGQEISNE